MLSRQSSESGAGNGRRRLFGSSGVESSGYVEMVSMSVHSYEGFVSTNSEVTDTSFSDVKNGMVVFIMFATLWGCGLLGLYELFKASYCSCCSKVQPEEEKKETERSDAPPTEVSCDSKKEYLLKYVDAILPTIFRSAVEHDSTLQSMWKTICAHHSYVAVFYVKGPDVKVKRIEKGVYLLTIQSMLFFIMVSQCILPLILILLVLILLQVPCYKIVN